MKTIIFYRSSYRGNTLKIAESMKDALSAELVSINSNPSIDLSDEAINRKRRRSDELLLGKRGTLGSGCRCPSQ